MKTRTFIFSLILILLLSLASAANAAPPSQNDNQPRIISFTSSASAVDRAALEARTARIPVSWAAVNRPLAANLIFEQVLPNGGVINVELPRLFPWVNTVGDGIAAPIFPNDDPTRVVLRVRLANMFTNETYDTRELILPIGNVPGQGTGTGSKPALTSFSSPIQRVSRAQLEAKSARIPVSWATSNRPVTANLIFEQVLPNGEVVNVELPRENPWVASSGQGVAAPVMPGAGVGSVRLRVRLTDMLTGRNYDMRYLLINIDDAPAPNPVIRYFTTSTVSLSSGVLQNRSARVPVSWLVDHRAEGTNLVFEQVLDNGQAVNVELPRSNPWVASSGDGVVAPLLPASADRIVVRLRVINLADNNTLATSEIQIPISDRQTQSPWDVCFKAPYAANTYLNTSFRARVTDHASDAGLTVYNNPAPNNQITGSLHRGEIVRIIDGPSCFASSTNALRQWKVRSESRALEGWVNEYTGQPNNPVMVLVLEPTVPVSPTQCFSAPFRPGAGIEAGKRARVTTNNLQVLGSSGQVLGLAQAGEIALVIEGPACFRYDPWGSNNQGEFRRWKIQIEGRNLEGWVNEYTRDILNLTYHLEPVGSTPPSSQPAEIISFTASPTSAKAGETITLTWEVKNASSVTIRAALSDPNATDSVQDGLPLSGSTTVTVPSNVGSGTTGKIHLYVYTQANASAAATQAVDIALTCPNDFFFGTRSDCATGQAQTVSGAYQAFEHGFAIWRSDTRMVYGFFADGRVFITSENWNGEDITYSETPPTGRLLPARGFGQVWVTTPIFRETLGWATAPEQGYNLQIQPGVVPGGTTYPTKLLFFSTPDGRAIRLIDGGAQSTWTFAS